MIIDNIVIGFKGLHSMKKDRFKNGSKLTIKLDMAMAYDRVEWCFFRKSYVEFWVLFKVGEEN